MAENLYNTLRFHAVRLSTYYRDSLRKGEGKWAARADERLWNEVHSVDPENVYQVSLVLNRVMNSMKSLSLA